MWPFETKQNPDSLDHARQPKEQALPLAPFAQAIPPEDPNKEEREWAAQNFVDLYLDNSYKMTHYRKRGVSKIVSNIAQQFAGGSLLDVGCGRGEALSLANLHGFRLARGVEIVPTLVGHVVSEAYAHELPYSDGAFDHVVSFAVVDALIEADIIPALREMLRVSRRTVTVSICVTEERPEQWWTKTLEQAWNRLALPCGNVMKSEPAWQLVKPA